VFGAWNTHGMNDINDAIDAANQSGSNYDEIKSGLTGGIGLRVWPTSNWMIAASWEPLFAETSDDASGATTNLDAQSFQGTLGYFFPTLMPAKFGIAAGAGMYTLTGEESFGSSSLDLEGSTVGFHAMGMTEMTVGPGFALTGALGWRWAEVEIEDASIPADYSGLMARVGLAFYLPTP
jgi:hypothetical protein